MEVVCESCGAANAAGTEFCMFCGTYLEWTGPEGRPERDVDTLPGTRPGASSTERPPATTAYDAGLATAGEQPVLLRTPARAVLVAEPPEVPPGTGGPALAAPEPTPVVAADPPCPACGRVNDPALHFCSRCGQTLREEPAAPAPSATSAWRRMLEERDRSAKRAYRRSLPPLYRWRRVVLAVLVPALVVGGLVAVGRHPVRWAQERWWDLKGSVVAVPGVTAGTSPEDASVTGSDPASLVDGTEQAWSEPWQPPAEGDSCGGAKGTGRVVLSFSPTRVREITINAGLPASNPRRPLEFRPQAVGVRFDSGPCRTFTLADVPDRQRLVVDSGVPVRTVVIGVDTTYPARSDGAQVLSLTEVGLWSRPS